MKNRTIISFDDIFTSKYPAGGPPPKLVSTGKLMWDEPTPGSCPGPIYNAKSNKDVNSYFEIMAYFNPNSKFHYMAREIDSITFATKWRTDELKSREEAQNFCEMMERYKYPIDGHKY